MLKLFYDLDIVVKVCMLSVKIRPLPCPKFSFVETTLISVEHVWL